MGAERSISHQRKALPFPQRKQGVVAGFSSPLLPPISDSFPEHMTFHHPCTALTGISALLSLFSALWPHTPSAEELRDFLLPRILFVSVHSEFILLDHFRKAKKSHRPVRYTAHCPVQLLSREKKRHQLRPVQQLSFL